MKKEIHSDKVAAAPHILSQAIEVNGFIFLSGQIGTDNAWNLINGGIQAETKKSLENIKVLLEENDCGMDDIVKVTLYVTNLSTGKEINEIYQTFFTSPLPAREMLEVSALPLGASIEISVIAVKN